MARRPDAIDMEDTLRCIRAFVDILSSMEVMDENHDNDGLSMETQLGFTIRDPFSAWRRGIGPEIDRALDQARDLGIDVAGIRATAQG